MQNFAVKIGAAEFWLVQKSACVWLAVERVVQNEFRGLVEVLEEMLVVAGGLCVQFQVFKFGEITLLYTCE